MFLVKNKCLISDLSEKILVHCRPVPPLETPQGRKRALTRNTSNGVSKKNGKDHGNGWEYLRLQTAKLQATLQREYFHTTFSTFEFLLRKRRIPA